MNMSCYLYSLHSLTLMAKDPLIWRLFQVLAILSQNEFSISLTEVQLMSIPHYYQSKLYFYNKLLSCC